MKELIIVGAGGFGREVFNYALFVQAQLAQVSEWKILGFLDDNPAALDGYKNYPPIVGTIREYTPRENDIFVMGIGYPTSQKLSIAESLVARGAEFISLLHPLAGVSMNTVIGKGCIIAPWAGISCDTQIGDFVTVNAYASIGHNSIIGDGCTISPYAGISGVKLGQGVLVGMHGYANPGVTVGDFATIAPGSVVLKNVKPGDTLMGVPAKIILRGPA